MSNGGAAAATPSPLPAEVAGALVDFVQPLVDAAASDGAAAALLAELGWQSSAVTGLVSAVRGSLTGVAAVVAALADLADELNQPGPAPSRSALDRLVTALKTGANLGHELERLASVAGTIANPPAGLNLLAEDMLLLLTDRYLRTRRPVVRSIAEALTLYVPSERGVARSPVTDASGRVLRTARKAPAWRLDRLGPLLRDPGTALRTAFVAGGSLGNAAAVTALSDALFPVIADVLAGLGFSARYGFDPYFDPQLPPDQAQLLGHSLNVWLADADESSGDAKLIGFSLALLPPEVANGHVGVAVSPWLPNGLETPFGSWNVSFDVTLGGAPFTVAGWQAQPGAPAGWPGLALTITFDYVPPGREAGAPPVSIAVTAGVSGSSFDVSLAARVRATPSIDPADLSDGFLRSVLPAQGLSVPVDATLTADRRGFRLAGSAASGGDVVLASLDHPELGPLSVTHAEVKASPRPDGITIGAYGSIAVALGPVKAAVDSIGLAANVRWPGRGGNAGPFDVDVDFAPPKGIALSIDAGAVTGGGFLAYDADRAQYSGALYLEIEGIALNAIGLLTTRLPGGQPGYSLLVIVTATGFQPIPLGFGFTLTGIGGLLGINRDVALEPLQVGLRSGALDPILFTKDDPTPRAAQIVDTLQTIFPPAPDRYVVGPMAQISWGSPPVLSIDVALLLQLPAPLRLLLLGRLRAALPNDKTAIVLLNMDVFGVIDFDRGTAAVDAVLHDSMVAGFALTGQMAMRISWRQDPGFALAVGGFHPRFAVPPGFPKLQRLALTLAAGDNPRLRLEAYLAITSNTVQLGGLLDFAARAGEFSLEGVFALDTLVHLSPFELSADLAALLALKQGASVLMAVAVRVALTGPAPWHVHGEASLQVAGLTLPPIPIDATFGEPRPLPLPPAIDLWTEQLQPALGNAGNWTGQLPPGGQGVRLAPQPLAAGEILLHPRGSLTIRQRVVPFDRDLDRFGTRPLAGARRFSIAALLVDGVAQSASALQPVVDDFAPAQFRRLADDEALAAPSFDPMPAGLSVTPAAAASGAPVAKRLVYKTVIRGVTGNRPGPAFALPAERVAPLAAAGAAGTAATRATGRVRFAGAPLGVRVERPGYVVATRSDLRQQAAGDGSYSGAVDALRRSIPAAQRATVQIVRRQEVIA